MVIVVSSLGFPLTGRYKRRQPEPATAAPQTHWRHWQALVKFSLSQLWSAGEALRV